MFDQLLLEGAVRSKCHRLRSHGIEIIRYKSFIVLKRRWNRNRSKPKTDKNCITIDTWLIDSAVVVKGINLFNFAVGTTRKYSTFCTLFDHGGVTLTLNMSCALLSILGKQLICAFSTGV